MQYKNVRHTENLQCNCLNWLDHWMQFTGSRVVPTCSVLGCGEKSNVGGHVKACDGKTSPWYIIPLCSEHNSSHFTECFDVKSHIKDGKLVSANVANTCR